MPLFPCLSHRVTTRCGQTLFGDFRLFGVHILLKTMDICGRKVPYVPGVGAQIAGAVPAVHVAHSGALPPIISNGHERRYCELGLAGSERLFLPPKIGPYSLHALHQVSARDAKANGDGGVIPAVHHPPLQQSSVRLCQVPEEADKSALLPVITTLLNPVSICLLYTSDAADE